MKPVPGNHEYVTAGAAGYFGYFGALAGDPSKGYYSYELGTWHVVALNSNCSKVSCSAGSAQESWLRQDLASHPSACTLAYWHHPRFSSGEHGNDTSVSALWKALVDHGVELVLSGHDHDYERFAPQNESGVATPSGVVQFVVGTGGTTLRPFETPLPTSLARNATDHGVLELTLNAGSYAWAFLPVAGKSYSDSGTTTCH
jgi:3',5'-cyclic AMP phosphodiesterase CpdA